MKSNIRILVMIGMISILMVSCGEDFLDVKPVGAFTEDQYVTNIAELETLLYSCYSLLNSYATDPGFVTNMAIQLFVMGNIGSDNAEKGSTSDDQEHIEFISMSSQLPANRWVWMFWLIHYDLIAKCNLVLDKSEDIAVADEELDQLEMILDQAKFLRALAYYHLVSLYGDIPLVVHWLDNTAEMKFTRSPKSEVWALIEQDLKDAANLPPKSETQNGRITHGAVHALLGKVYLWQEKYDLAIEAFTEVIESGEYQLVTDYGKIYRYEGENCEESIIEFQEEMNVDGGHMVSYAGNFRVTRDDWFGWGFDNPTQNLVDEFEPGDPRQLYTINFAGDVFPGGPQGLLVISGQGSDTGYTTRKAWVPWEDRSDYPLAINWRYCRFAEVLLYYAEALNEEGQPDLARTYLNMVRKRARNTPKIDPQRISTVWDSTNIVDILPDVTTNDPDELRNLIWHEQRVELAQEGHRRWNLLRYKKFKEQMEAAKGDKGCTVEDHELLLPIPGDEVTASRGNILQNPGYN